MIWKPTKTARVKGIFMIDIAELVSAILTGDRTVGCLALHPVTLIDVNAHVGIYGDCTVYHVSNRLP